MKKINNSLFTYHGYKRIKERSNISEKEINRISIWAMKNGLNFQEIPPGPLKSYVGFKKAKKGKKIKLYRGYVFVFFLNSKRVITCYPIPEKHMAEYQNLIKEKKGKKKV